MAGRALSLLNKLMVPAANVRATSKALKVPPMPPTVRAAAPTTRPPAELLEIGFRCAAADKAFTGEFEKVGESYLFRRLRMPAPGGQGGGKTAPPPLRVPIARVSFTGLNCPHCRATIEPIRCGSCGQLVCSARVEVRPSANTTGQWFQCADSCGGHGWLMTQLREIAGQPSNGADEAPRGAQSVPSTLRISSSPGNGGAPARRA